MKHRSKFVRGLYNFGLFRIIYGCVMYFLLAPVRLVNAIWYDIVVYGVFSFKDELLDVVAPRLQKWTKKKNFVYYFCWIFGLPFRIIMFLWHGGGRIFEGLVFTIVDLFVPTLTMRHGTSEESSIQISKPGQWLVGNGNYAGSGIYFTMSERVALHYAHASSNGYKGGHPVIIYARVALGRNINLAVAPDDIQSKLHGRDGDGLTQWGLKKGYDSFEWWRDDEAWWEYCMLKLPRGKMIKTWRIRVLYIQEIHDATHKEIKRVWGGKAFWLSLI